MRQLLGTEPLQAIFGAMNKKEENDKHYCIRMIDSMDPVAALQPEQQEKEGEATYEEVSLLQKARDIAAAIQQRKQQSRQQQRQPTTTNDNNGNDGEEDTTRRRIETPRRQEEDTTAVTEMAIMERQERGVLQVRKRRRRRLAVAYYDYGTSLPLYNDHVSFSSCVHYIAICCSATTASIRLR